MNLRTVGSTIALSILLTACATTYEDRAIKDKNYSGALYSVSYYEAKAGRDDVDKLVARIKDAAGSQYQLQFYEDTKKFIQYKEKNRAFFKDMVLYMANAQRGGLLDAGQAADINQILYKELAQQAILKPTILNAELKESYPDLPKYMGAAYESEYRRALNGELPDLEAYASVYSAMKNSDNAKAAALLPVVRTKMADLIKSMGPGAWRDLAGVLAVYTATRDPVIEQHVLQFVTRADLSKKQLKEEVATVLPDLAAKARAERELQVKIVSDSNDPFIDELPKALEDFDEWITVEDEAKRKLTIARLRITERPGNPLVRTQTVSDLDFATRLLIPKNASVLYDTTTTNYEISWSMNVSDSAGKGSKVISGKKSEQKIECSNIRYKNVFGGEGEVGLIPTSIQGVCNRKSGINFDAIRSEAVKEIAGEIVQLLRKDQKVSGTTRS